MAERQLGQGRHQQAVASLRRALAAEEDEYSCTLRIADILRSRQRWHAAFHAAETAASMAPGRLPAYEMTLAIALEAGDQPRIVVAARTLVKLDPKNMFAYDALSTAYLQIGDVDAAMRVADRLIRLDPVNAAHRFRKALLCQHRGEVGRAVHEFTQAIILDPEGLHSSAARDALEALDSYQLNQIATLAMEDMVFRAKLARDPVVAASERGFTLSELGNTVLTDLTTQSLSDLPEPCRPALYN